MSTSFSVEAAPEAPLVEDRAIARREWALSWPVALLAMIGVAGCAMFTVSCGVLLSAITREFAWSRAAFSCGYMLQMLSGLVMMPAAGWLTTRFGPRRVALCGTITFVVCNGLTAFANGDIWQWRILCVFITAGTVGISPVVWIAAIVPRFHVSRGLAFSVALAGVGISAIIWPPLSEICAGAVGWRYTFFVLALGWAIVAFPLAWFVLPRARAGSATGTTRETKSRLRDFFSELKSRVFISVVAAGCMLSFISVALTLHLVAMLQSHGLSLAIAARIVGISGVATLIGSISTGFVLDRIPARWVGLFMFSVPAFGALILLAAGASFWLSLAAAVCFAFTTGAEMNLLAYIASRQLDQERFPPAYAILQSLLTVVSSVGPLVAGALFDWTGAYTAFLWLAVPVSLIGALVIWSIPSKLGAGQAV